MSPSACSASVNAENLSLDEYKRSELSLYQRGGVFDIQVTRQFTPPICIATVLKKSEAVPAKLLICWPRSPSFIGIAPKVDLSDPGKGA